MIDPLGDIKARYEKLHLFDVVCQGLPNPVTLELNMLSRTSKTREVQHYWNPKRRCEGEP